MSQNDSFPIIARYDLVLQLVYIPFCILAYHYSKLLSLSRIYSNLMVVSLATLVASAFGNLAEVQSSIDRAIALLRATNIVLTIV